MDGGCEFYREFEQECRRRGVRLYVVPPRSPEKRGYVERAQGDTPVWVLRESYGLPVELGELRQFGGGMGVDLQLP